ncbi:MAG: Trp biosynthesis-associated membrane protein [Lacisediminihabitans sp.]
MPLPQRPEARRLKSLSLLGAIALSALTLLAWTQPWFTVLLSGTDVSRQPIVVTGEVAAPGLAALSLAGFALVAALAIAGPFFRVVLGVLQAVIGGCVVLSGGLAVADPANASAAAVTKISGVSGADSVAALVASAGETAWPWIAILLGVVTVLLGAFVVLTGRRWPGSARRYQPVRFEEAETSANPVSDWDRLSGGSDPTSR